MNTMTGEQVRSHRRERIVGSVAATLLTTLVALCVATPSAFAYQRYAAAADGLALRSGPGTQYAVLQRVNSGTPLDIDCQIQGGTNVGGNATWDRLTGGQWVADYFTTTPSFNSYAPGLGPCPGTPATSGAERAASWAEARIGQVTTTENRNSTLWSGWCETFVEGAWSSAGTNFQYASADADYASRSAQGQIRLGVPPRGALVFYVGHVAISVGGGNVVSTIGNVGERRPVARVSYTWFSNAYRGWAMPA